MLIHEQWTQRTGLDWSEAKKRGYTDGSYAGNIKLKQLMDTGEIYPDKVHADDRIKPGNPLYPKTSMKDQAVTKPKPTLVKTNNKLVSVKPVIKTAVAESTGVSNKPVTPKLNPSKVPVYQDPNKYSKLPSDVRTTVGEKQKNPKFQTYQGKYYVMSKENSTMYVFDNKHNLVDQAVVGRGAAVGDHPNVADPNTAKPGPGATTPGGSGVFDGVVDGYGKPAYTVKYNDPNKIKGATLALHQLYPPEFLERNKILNDPKEVDKLMSWGCINLPNQKLQSPTFKPKVGDSIFISNEPARNALKASLNKKAAGK